MKTFEEILTSIKSENHSRTTIVNGEEILLSDVEFNKAIEDKAKMVFEQEKELSEKQNAKLEILNKLGITEDEARLLLGGN